MQARAEQDNRVPEMSVPYPEFKDHPSAWRSSDLASLDELAFELTPRHVGALEKGLAEVAARDLALYDITRADFPLTEIAEDVAAIRREVATGRGIVLVRGFPVDRHGEDDIAIMYWGLGTHFGTALSQSVVGDRLGRVTNVGDLDPNERAYRNRRGLNPHTDRSHIIAMLCVRRAKTGGTSGYVNGLAVHNVVAAEHPEHLPVLYRGFATHHFGEQAAGEPPVSHEMPIFSVSEGVPSMQYIRGYYDMAREELGVDYTDEERAALDFMDEVNRRPEIKLDILHDPGEASFINNYIVMHSRTTFEDYDDPAQKRLFLRLWLHDPDARPLAAPLVIDEAYAGVPAQEGRDSAYFTGWGRGA